MYIYICIQALHILCFILSQQANPINKLLLKYKFSSKWCGKYFCGVSNKNRVIKIIYKFRKKLWPGKNSHENCSMQTSHDPGSTQRLSAFWHLKLILQVHVNNEPCQWSLVLFRCFGYVKWTTIVYIHYIVKHSVGLWLMISFEILLLIRQLR